MAKNGLGISVYEAAIERIKIVFDSFEKVYVSFSGGKDSSVMLHLVADEARKRGRRIGCLFVDLEAQYKYTVDHVIKMYGAYEDVIDPYWICLPIALRNAVSVFEPKWECWDIEKKTIWVRDYPEKCISDVNFFHFFRRGMEFEDFVPKFGDWYSEGKKTACFVGIRSDESLNRYRTIANKKKEKYKNFGWTTKIHGTSVYNAYPIYDWRTRDIWIYNSKLKAEYNHLYDVMQQAGLSIHQQRICQPYGDDQRKGLWLYQVIEPDTWSKVLARVNGANSGSNFVKYPGNGSGQIKITKPENHTWESFSNMLIETMPDKIKEHYQTKIHVFLNWYEKRGWVDSEGLRTVSRIIPDENTGSKESKDIPSWKRICKMLLRNDYWAKTLSFAQTKDGFFYKRYMERVKRDRDKRKLEILRKAGRGWI